MNSTVKVELSRQEIVTIFNIVSNFLIDCDDFEIKDADYISESHPTATGIRQKMLQAYSELV